MIDVREVNDTEIEAVSHFLLSTMGEVFPFPLSQRSLRDLEEMKERFLDRKDATFLAAFFEGKVVGTLAIDRYDNRIKALRGRFDLDATCEVIKCYADRNKRRQGIGSLLFEKATEFSKRAGYQTMYLHTHKFLPGGFTFWRKKGFSIILDEGDPFETVHMEKGL
ncbi:GNAT family N-acetyltransferase [Anaerobacillus sp. CMMVII]|uniref:GNAT family N-acetyltransferase n=1 Tax=Anaerobacillus sp. CMMVII TaxID=2755588 RepID=UPI0021B7C167|nr:GNAT family N-acetyltransferase [Anaerobacillus sp. CMMVII]MCT8137032.1 GNAT family N-acetyltransferase [Anaerobacillus sp. CMMVII]